MKSHNPTWDIILKTKAEYRDYYWDYWKHNDLFSIGWWLLFVINLVFIYIAIKILDRSRLFELLTVGGIIISISTMLDTILIQYGLTAYPTSLTPISPSFFVNTYIILPVIYALLYQFFSTWKSYFIANILTGIFLAFIIETLLRWLHIYQYIHWNSFYSFLAYFGMGLFSKVIMKILCNKQIPF